jgi:hypothetical protein
LSEIALAGAALFGMVGIPVRTPTWPLLQVDIERASFAVEGKGGHLVEPGQPGGFLGWSKPKLQLAARVQPIQTLLSGPDKGVKRCSGHRTLPVSALFPTIPQFLPTPRSIPKRRLIGKERASCRENWFVGVLSMIKAQRYIRCHEPQDKPASCFLEMELDRFLASLDHEIHQISGEMSSRGPTPLQTGTRARSYLAVHDILRSAGPYWLTGNWLILTSVASSVPLSFTWAWITKRVFPLNEKDHERALAKITHKIKTTRTN